MIEADDPKGIDHTELATLLQNEERLASNYRSGTLAVEQELAMEYYEAKPFGDEEEGRSQVVTPDVAEVVDYMTISILRTCVSGDRVVEFEANEEEQEEAAQEATEAVSYAFMRGQDGYKVLSDWLQSGLIEKIGVVKTACIEETKKRKENFECDEDQLASLMESDTPPIAVTPYEEEETTEDGQPIGPRYLVQVESERTVKRYVDMPIPSEEFLFSVRCRDVDDIGYKAHRVRKTISELIEMGFDRDTVEGLPTEDRGSNLDTRSTARWDDEDVTRESELPGMRRVWLLEEYVHIDANGDGILELLQVFRVGRVILSVEEVEENPFVVFVPFPRAHRMVGNSLADKVMDLQRIRSVIMRQTLDGIYLTNNPRMWLPEECQTDDTIDDLLTVRPGGIIRGRGAGGQPMPLHEPFDVSRGLGIMEFLIGERESRTGITRLNQGLDADAVNKTATGTALMQAQGQQMEEYIARNFAEAMSRLFLKKLRLMVDNGDPIAVKVEGGFKTVDPKNWSYDMDVSIRIGLGSGRKDQRVANRMQLVQMQREGLMAGLVHPKNIYKNVAGLIRDMALGEPEDFWPNPDSPEAQQEAAQKAQQPQPPSPEEMKAQADMQAQQAQLQLSQQKAQADIQMQQHKAELSMQLERDKAQLQAELQRQKASAEYDLAMQKMQMDAELQRHRMALEMEHKQNMADGGDLPTYRAGGELDK